MAKHYLFALLLALGFRPAFAARYFVAPAGNDASSGTIQQPFLTIQRAQTAVAAGDTVYVRGGTYTMQTAQVALYSGGLFAFVTNLTKSGTSANRIKYWAYPGERPVFNYTNVNPSGFRINAFEVSGSWLHLRGLEVRGLQVNITNANTQSIGFSTNGGGNNIYEQCTVHDGQGIGFYLTRGANNLFLNCDAYRNYDYTSQTGGGVNGGNVDGFGNHPNAGSVGNVYRGCRAWFNSDDGYDCISSQEATVFENCWSFYNGYGPGFVSHGDGNGFKAGGYGNAALTGIPVNVPRNTVRFCLSVRNKTNGFYSNHHLQGSDWYNNAAYQNATNFDLLNRLARNATDYLTDVPGYAHVVRNNVSYLPRSAGRDLADYDPSPGANTIDHNTFLNPSVTVAANDFLSLDTTLLRAPRQADGSLPILNFMRLAPGSDLIDAGINVGFPYRGTAPDLGPYEFATALATGPAALAQQVAFYPNPAHTQVAIDLPPSLCRQPVTVALIDALGRVVRQQHLPAGEGPHVLPLADVAPGLYSLRLTTELGPVMKELVVE